MRLKIREAVRDDVVADVSIELDDKTVIPESKFGRTAFELGQVDVASGETTEDAIERPRSVGILETYDRRAVIARRCGNNAPSHFDEASRVARVIGDIFDQYI